MSLELPFGVGAPARSSAANLSGELDRLRRAPRLARPDAVAEKEPPTDSPPQGCWKGVVQFVRKDDDLYCWSEPHVARIDLTALSAGAPPGNCGACVSPVIRPNTVVGEVTVKACQLSAVGELVIDLDLESFSRSGTPG